MPIDGHIAIGGENLIDSVHSTNSDGTKAVAHKLGGSPYNVAVAVARQGHNVSYLTPISTDDFGNQLAAYLVENGVGIAADRNAKPTTEAVITLKDGVPSYVFKRDGTAERAVTAASIAAVLPADARHFHAGSLAFAGGDDADAWEEAFHAAAAKGLVTSLDPNVRPSLIEDADGYRARLLRLLKTATIVKLSDEDIEWMFPGKSLPDAIATLREFTDAPLVALTKGPDGAECWTASGHCSVPNPPVPNLVDTIGAGDTFMATLIATLAHQDQLSADALAAMTQEDTRALIGRALQAACLNCAKEGCDPPTSPEIDEALVKAGS